MFWQVRAVLEDRPGAMAALAGLCGDHDINILGLQIFPAVGGQVVDEFVVSTAEGWSAERIEGLFSSSGVRVTTVVECSVHVLEDQPVRYLRAARAVMDDPDALSEVLRGLGAGPGTPVTDTEIARAAELRRFAGSAVESLGSVEHRAATGVQPALRRGAVADAERIVAMHQRCSADALYRRYHAPTPRTTLRQARRLLEPDNGWSVVAEVGDRIVAIGMVGGEVPEVGLLVEDGWQGQGLGSKILGCLVQEAASRGITELICLAQTDNEAVPRMIHRAGLHARAGLVDGVVRYTVPVRTAGPAGRELHRPADFIDQAVRG